MRVEEPAVHQELLGLVVDQVEDLELGQHDITLAALHRQQAPELLLGPPRGGGDHAGGVVEVEVGGGEEAEEEEEEDARAEQERAEPDEAVQRSPGRGTMVAAGAASWRVGVRQERGEGAHLGRRWEVGR